MRAKNLVLALIGTFLLSITIAFAQVAITPSNPTADQDLVCSLQGGNAGAYVFRWFLGADEKSSSSILSQSFTQPSQTWTCKVFIPANAYTKREIYVSEASVTTAALPVIPDTVPVPDFSTSANPVAEGTSVTFTDLSTSADPIVSRAWNLGDGTYVNFTNPSHVYLDDGVYVINLTVVDNDGSVRSITKTVTVTDNSPFANFTVSNTTAFVGKQVNFTDYSYSYPDAIASWKWRFGDGTSATTQNATHSYAAPGTYIFNLTVVDDDGSVGLRAGTIVIVSVPDTTAPIISNVNSSRLRNSSAVINWTTNELSNTSVNYGVTYALGTKSQINNAVLLHTRALASLQPSTTYRYNITSCDIVGNCRTSGPFTFTTRANSPAPNFYGVVRDTNTGMPIAGANISFYDNATCYLDEVSLVESGSCMLDPKPIPDAVTDSNGNYALYLPPAVYHMVVQHSKQVDRNIFHNNSNQNHSPELKENQGKNINFEGHILYGGRYRDGNKYIVGDNLTFVMFGVNHDSLPETVTFLVEKHTSGGSNGPWVLNGSFGNPGQTLTVPAGGAKVNKKFSFIIPPSLSEPGRYDIHVMVNDAGTFEKWHKIGNFFIVDVNAQNRTPPYLRMKSAGFYPNVKSINASNYVNQSINVSFKLRIPPQDGTIPGILLTILPLDPTNCSFGPAGNEVIISAPNGIIFLNGVNRTGIFRINVTDTVHECYMEPRFLYKKSDKYKINFSVKEQYYGVISPLKFVNVSVWATEQQARDIYYDITENTLARPGNKPADFTGYYAGDRNSNMAIGGYGAINVYNQNMTDADNDPSYYFVNADLVDTQWGFEYRSKADGLDVGNLVFPAGTPKPCQNDANVALGGVTECERDALTARWNSLTSPHYLLVVDPMTTDQIAQRVIAFGDYMVSNGPAYNP
jgi:PKD repeat protein